MSLQEEDLLRVTVSDLPKLVHSLENAISRIIRFPLGVLVRGRRLLMCRTVALPASMRGVGARWV
jgi:hypothetical protein